MNGSKSRDGVSRTLNLPWETTGWPIYPETDTCRAAKNYQNSANGPKLTVA